MERLVMMATSAHLCRFVRPVLAKAVPHSTAMTMIRAARIGAIHSQGVSISQLQMLHAPMMALPVRRMFAKTASVRIQIGLTANRV